MSNLRKQLQGIYDQHGSLTPEMVVDEARDPDSPLHDRFEWDDVVAAEKWRREQAHELIQSVKIHRVEPSGKQSELRAFQAIRRPSGYVYEPTEEVARDEMASQILLNDMRREWHALKRRYDQFEEFRDMVRADVDAA